MSKTAWGIEAGTSSVKAVKLSHDGKGGVTIIDMSIIRLADFRVAGGDEYSALLGALSELVHDRQIKSSDTAYISLPGRNAFSRVITLPPVSQDAIRDTIAYEARGQIPIKLDDAVWDYQQITSGEDGETQVNLYAVKRDVVTALVNICKAASLPVSGIQLAPLGIYNFVKYELDASISTSCVAIEIGADNTELLIIDGERTSLRAVPFAGNDVTKALLMRDKKLTPEKAEQLKRDAGQRKDAAVIFDAMKPPLKEMVGEIYRSVGFYKSQNDKAVIDKLVMMGNGSKLFNIAKFFEQQLQYETHVVKELTSILCGRGVDAQEVQKNVQALTVAIGLGLQGVGVPGLNTINLVPSELAVEEAMGKVRPLAIASGALVFAAGLLTFVLSLPTKSDAQEKLGDLEKSAKSITQRNLDLQGVVANDDDRLRTIVNLVNADHGDKLAYYSYLMMDHVLSRFQRQQTAEKWDIYLCKSPDGGSSSEGLSVVLKEAQFKAIPGRSGAPQVFERSVKVEVNVQLAVELSGDKTSSGAMEKVANKLSKELNNAVRLLIIPETEWSAEWGKKFDAAFGVSAGGSPELVSAMRDLRVLVQKIPNVSKEDVFGEKIGTFANLSGQLLQANTLDLSKLFPVSGALPQLGKSTKYAAQFFHMALTLTLVAEPYRISGTTAGTAAGGRKQ